MKKKVFIRGVIEMSVAFALFSALIWLSTWLQGPFSMTGSASIFILGVVFLVAFLRAYLLEGISAVWFFVGVLLAALWYPYSYTTIGSAYTNGPGLSSPRFYEGLLLALWEGDVYRPLLMLVAASFLGAALGCIARRLLSRVPKPRGI